MTPQLAGLIFLGIVVYLVPAWVAAFRKHEQGALMFMLNLMLGWTVVVWVGVLVWALTTPAQSPAVGTTEARS